MVTIVVFKRILTFIVVNEFLQTPKTHRVSHKLIN